MWDKFFPFSPTEFTQLQRLTFQSKYIYHKIYPRSTQGIFMVRRVMAESHVTPVAAAAVLLMAISCSANVQPRLNGTQSCYITIISDMSAYTVLQNTQSWKIIGCQQVKQDCKEALLFPDRDELIIFSSILLQKPIFDGEFGPYEAGQELTLTCSIFCKQTCS